LACRRLPDGSATPNPFMVVFISMTPFLMDQTFDAALAPRPPSSAW
jgi:hypothetical protein